MSNFLKKFNSAEEYYFEEGCFIVEVSNSSDDPQLSIVRARVEPGKTTEWHSLKGTVERYVIISGSGSVEIGDKTASAVTANDVVIIPAGVRQRITNTGLDQLIFLAICSPRFESTNYQRIG